jgi:hypothetical protein
MAAKIKSKPNEGAVTIRVKTGPARARQICAEAMKSDSHQTRSNAIRRYGKRGR